MRVVEVLTQGACCGLKVQIRKNVLDVCVYVLGEKGVACHQECVREIFETRTFEYLKRERYFVSASHSGLSSSPLS